MVVTEYPFRLMSNTLSTLLDLPAVAAGARLRSARILAGASSWAERTLVKDGSFYPSRSLSARARLAYYCQRLPLAEVATTFRFPPTPELAAQWAERTPDGFTLDLRAWSLLTDAPTLPDSLWPDLQGQVKPTKGDRRRLYAAHLQPGVIDECWERFAHALRPLVDAGRLGVVIASYPSWWGPRPETWAELALLSQRLPGCRIAVELHHPRWFEGDACEGTLEFLEQHGLAYVCLDGPDQGPRALSPVVAATAEVSVVRFRGRRCVEGEPWTWPYRYSDEDLRAWLPRLADLASSSTAVHVIMDNCWRADAVDNAGRLLELVAQYEAG